MANPSGGGRSGDEAELPPAPASHRRTIVGLVFGAAAMTAAVVTALRERHTFVAAFDHLGATTMAASLVAGLAGVGATFLAWDQIRRGYGIELPRWVGLRLFFISQLGKYLPGSVWPAVMQMEAGRRRGASPRTMLSANLTALVVGCSSGLLVACCVLPWYDAEALTGYWWLFLAVPLLLALLHPRSLPALIDVPFRLLKRPALDQRLDAGHELRAAGWSLLSWVGLGAEVGVLAAGVASHHHLASTLVLSVGAMGLAMTAGILFLPAPAGAGVREVILVLVLSRIMDTGSALAVAIASRVVLILCDMSLAAAAAVLVRERETQPVVSGTDPKPE